MTLPESTLPKRTSENSVQLRPHFPCDIAVTLSYVLHEPFFQRTLIRTLDGLGSIHALLPGRVAHRSLSPHARNNQETRGPWWRQF